MRASQIAQAQRQGRHLGLGLTGSFTLSLMMTEIILVSCGRLSYAYLVQVFRFLWSDAAVCFAVVVRASTHGQVGVWHVYI